MRTLRRFGLAVAGALALGSLVAPSEAGSWAVAPSPVHAKQKADQPSKPKPLKRYAEYVALGDSWTANVVILNADGPPDGTHAPQDCAQSHRNYPKLVAAAIKVKTFRDASCGSATTDDFRNPQTGLPAGGTNPPRSTTRSQTPGRVCPSEGARPSTPQVEWTSSASRSRRRSSSS